MEKIKLTIKYWQMVLSEAWNIAWRDSGVKRFTLALFGALIFFIILFSLSTAGVLPENWRILIGDFSAEVRTNLLYSLGAILIGTIIFTFSLVYVPAKIHDAQNRRIAQLESRNKSKSIKTDKIKFEPKEEYPKLNGGEYYAYLEIQNNENDDLRDCYATLNQLFIKDADGWLNMTERINPNLNHLTWPGFRREEEKIVRRKKTSRINIAKTIPNNIAFIFENGDNPALLSMYESDKVYYVDVEVNGLLNGKPIDGVVFRGFLHYVAKLTQEENRPPLPYFRLYIEPGEIDEKEIPPSTIKSIQS